MEPTVTDRKFLDTPTIDSMLRDVRDSESGERGGSVCADLCCHIKALAADRDNLAAYIAELQGKLALAQAREDNDKGAIRRLHDATIILRNAIGKSPCREQLRRDVDQANELIESIPAHTMTDAFDATNANVLKAKAVVERIKPTEIWNDWVPQAEHERTKAQVAQLLSDRETLIESIKDAAVRHDLEIEAQREEIFWLRKEIDNTIEILIPADCRVRVCEGGGPEDVCKSLAVSVAKMAVKYERLYETRLHQVQAVADVCEENAGEQRRKIDALTEQVRRLQDAHDILIQGYSDRLGRGQ